MSLDEGTGSESIGSWEALEHFFDGDKGFTESEFKELYESGGLSMVSHLYGLSRREEQFQDLYQSFRKYKRFSTAGGFRDSSRRRQEAYDEMIDAFETYFGPVSQEVEEKAVSQAANTAAYAEFTGMMENLVGQVSEQDLREMVEDFRETALK
ncbi:MAG: hypothetical protein ABEK00_01965 [Candidatus Nanohaloarchaea archaeon]